MDKQAVNCYSLTLGHLFQFVAQAATRLCKNQQILSLQDQCLWLNSGTHNPFFNGVIDYAQDFTRLSALLTKAKNDFNRRPCSWWYLADDLLSIEAQQILNKHKFYSAGKFSGIKLLIEAMNTEIIVPNEISIKKVKTRQDCQIFYDIFFEVFQMAGIMKIEFQKMLDSLLCNENYSGYIGFYENKPVGVASSFIIDEVVGLYNAATLTHARNKGVGTALQLQRIKDAKAKGCRLAVAQLMAKNMAGGIAKRLGFSTLCQFTPYIYGVPADQVEP